MKVSACDYLEGHVNATYRIISKNDLTKIVWIAFKCPDCNKQWTGKFRMEN
jgi:hypothetical protein